MMSPEIYYEKELKGKSPQEIEKIIGDINQEMKSLRKAIEAGYFCYGGEEDTRPENRKKLELCRSYLEEALKAHKQAGGDYKLSKEEQHIADFDAAIPEIKKISFSIYEGLLYNEEEYMITVDNNCSQFWIDDDDDYDYDSMPTENDRKPIFSMKREEFFEKLRNIHMGEWRLNYDSSDYGWLVMDGTNWDIDIEYKNGLKEVNFSGSNAFPFSFWDFYTLISGKDKYEPEEEFEEDDE